MENVCISCGSICTRSLLELGPQPPSNRFLLDAKETCDSHNICFDVCTKCYLAQLKNPISPNIVRSHFDWISYNEPEGHLDQLVEFLVNREDFVLNAKIVGITYKDDTTLARLNNKGFNETYRLSRFNDLGINDPLASLETIQSTFSPALAEKLAAKIGRPDILIVRHILEHAHQPRRFLDACEILCKQGGLFVLEVPNCQKMIHGNDHCFLWEEHISYFTPETFMRFLEINGFYEFDILVFPYLMEDSLIAVVSNNRSLSKKTVRIDVNNELLQLGKFGNSFHERGHRIRKHLQSLINQDKRVALFGAGHHAVKFINFYDLANYLVGVIDDNPNKLGRFMPGSNLPIIESSCLENGDIDLCLLTLNPESEQKVLKANAGYVSRGGRFRSIFSASSISIVQDILSD